MTEPIRPDDIAAAKAALFPAAVFAAFNELIAEHYVDGVATFRQEAVVARILASGNGYDRDGIFARGWLNVEATYRAAGWRVEYDKPGYNETYAATFTFSHGRR